MAYSSLPFCFSGALRVHNGGIVEHAAGSDTDDARGEAIEAAQTAASAGDLIFVGCNANLQSPLGKDGVNWWVAPHATITADIEDTSYLFTDDNASHTYSIFGRGNFISPNGAQSYFGGASNVRWEFGTISNNGNGVSTIYGANPDLKLTMDGDELIAVEYDALWIDQCKEFRGKIRRIYAGDNCIEGYGGSYVLKCESMIGARMGASIGFGTDPHGPIQLYGGRYHITADEIACETSGYRTLTVTATGGTFTITVTVNGSAKTTENIAYNASAATIQTALRALDFSGGNGTNSISVFDASPIHIYTPSVLGEISLSLNVGSLTGGTATFGAVSNEFYSILTKEDGTGASQGGPINCVIDCPNIVGQVRYESGNTEIRGAHINSQGWAKPTVDVKANNLTLTDCRVTTDSGQTNSFTALSRKTVQTRGEFSYNKLSNEVQFVERLNQLYRWAGRGVIGV